MKFSEKEMESTIRWMPEGIKGESIMRYDSPITARENYLRMFRKGEKCEWIPTHADCIGFCPAIIPDCIARGMVREAQALPRGQEGGKDMFGMNWVFEEEVGGSMIPQGEYLFDDANEWKEKVVFPDLDSWDWQGCADRNRGIFFDTERPTEYIQLTGLFERLMSFMTIQNALMALLDEDQEEALHELFDALCNFYDDLIDRLQRYFHIDIFQFHDDWGTQRGPMISPDTIREMLAPYIKRIVESCHKRGILFHFHCCGKNEKLVPIMIECGIDQWDGQTINDFDYLYENYGGKIVLGITPQDCRTEEDPEKAYQVGTEFAERYAENFDEKPVVAVLRRALPEYRDAIYRCSRIRLGES